LDSDAQMNAAGHWYGRMSKLMGVAGLGCLAYAGAHHLSHWIIPLGSLIFTSAFMIERRALWTYALSTSCLAKLAR
jgi:hypothetical protein